MKITAYKDSKGKIHDNRTDWEISECLIVFEMESYNKDKVETIIKAGKVAQRLKKLYESHKSNSQ